MDDLDIREQSELDHQLATEAVLLRVIEDLKHLLTHGHGGGNWRRLIIMTIAKYEKEVS